MKKLVTLSLILCGSASSAQFIVTGPNVPAGTVSPGSSSYQGIAPLSPDYGLSDNSITPTMRRQRTAMARQVEQAFPNLRTEMARYSPARARYLYARAEKKATWARINANR